MHKRTVQILALALSVLASSWAAADTLYLRNGEQAAGQLVEITQDSVTFRTLEGVQTYPEKDVFRVQLQRARMHDEVNQAGQITDPDLKQAIENQPGETDYPAAGYVVMLERRTLDLSQPDKVVDTTRQIIKILRQRGEDVASQNVWYFEDTDVPHIDFALTVTPDGRVLHLDDAAVKNESLYANLPDYRRSARYRFACKEPRPGSILDIQYTVERGASELLDPFYAFESFQGDQPILKKEVVVTVPEGRRDQVVANLADQGAVKQEESTQDGTARLVWSLNEPQAAVIPEPLMPPLRLFVPRVHLGHAGAWDGVAAAYRSALDELPALPDNWVQRAKDLAGNGGAEAIRNWVAREIRLVPVPQLSFRLVPHSAADTLSRALANELDKNYVYYLMLRAADIPAEFAFVRSRTMGPLPQDIPSLKAFNNTAVYLPKQEMFSSAAGDTLPFQALPGALQNCDALVFGNDGGLRKTPLAPPEGQLSATRFDAALDAEGTLQATITYTAEGDEQNWMRNLKDLNQQQMRNQLQQLAGYIHPSAALMEYSTTDLSDLTVTPEITLTVAVPEFGSVAGDLMLLKLPAVFYTAQEVGRPTRELDLFWNYPVRETTRGTIKLPAGFGVYYLPEEVNFDSDVASYRATFTNKDNTITFEDRYDLNVAEAPASAYPEYKQCLELRARIPQQRIILTKE